MRRFINSGAFILVWGAAVILYWPAGVILSIIGLGVDYLSRKEQGEKMA